MIKKIILPLVAVALFIIGVGIFLQKADVLTPTPQATATGQGLTINGKKISVEIARTALERQRGLSGRTSLNPDSGMLFVFAGEDRSPVFWMKDMLMPIDIIWIRAGKVIKIDKNVPAPNPEASDSQLANYSAEGAVDYVLEMEAGYSDSNSIKVGDSVTLSGI